jgi:hypothetical protein
VTLGRFDASMMLHEDYEGFGAYLYELNDTLDPGLGAKKFNYFRGQNPDCSYKRPRLIQQIHGTARWTGRLM